MKLVLPQSMKIHRSPPPQLPECKRRMSQALQLCTRVLGQVVGSSGHPPPPTPPPPHPHLGGPSFVGLVNMCPLWLGLDFTDNLIYRVSTCYIKVCHHCSLAECRRIHMNIYVYQHTFILIFIYLAQTICTV
jgi:hypothetical protein